MANYAKKPYRQLHRDISNRDAQPFAYLDVEWFKALSPNEFTRAVKERGYRFERVALLKRQMAAQSPKAEREARAAKEAAQKAEIMRQINELTQRED